MTCVHFLRICHAECELFKRSRVYSCTAPVASHNSAGRWSLARCGHRRRPTDGADTRCPVPPSSAVSVRSSSAATAVGAPQESVATNLRTRRGFLESGGDKGFEICSIGIRYRTKKLRLWLVQVGLVGSLWFSHGLAALAPSSSFSFPSFSFDF